MQLTNKQTLAYATLVDGVGFSGILELLSEDLPKIIDDKTSADNVLYRLERIIWAVKRDQDKTLHVSDLPLERASNSWSGYRLETKTDAYRIVWDKKSMRSYIAEFGDCVLRYDNVYDVYRVTEFALIRAEYNNKTAEYFARYGCE